MSTLLDERCMTVWTAPSGKKHVEGWFNQALCGKHIGQNWRWHDLTSVRWLGKIAQGRGYGSGSYCKICASNYKDVNVDAE